MKKVALCLTAAILSLSLMTPCHANEKVLLRCKLEKGKTYSTRSVCEEEVLLDIRGVTLPMTIKDAVGMSYRVEDVDTNGDATVSGKFETIYFKSQTPWGPILYDSTDPPVYLAGGMQVFDSMLGQKITLKIAPDGRIKDVQGVDALLTRILGRMDLPEGPEGVMFVKRVRAMFNEKAVQDALKSEAGLYSDEPVSPGEIWYKKGILSLSQPLPVEYTYRLKSLEDGIAKIGVSSRVKKNFKAQAEPDDNKSVYHITSGTEQGEIEADAKSGWVVRGKFKQKLSGQMKTKGMTIPITIESSETLEPRVEQSEPKIEIIKSE